MPMEHDLADVHLPINMSIMKTQSSNDLDRRHTTTAATSLRLLACLALSLASQCVVLGARADGAINNLPKPLRLPFLFKLKPRISATHAYLGRLQNELETTQRQLYISQQTCTTLRKRFEEQRTEVLALTRTHAAASIGSEEDRHRIKVQDEEIELLKSQLELEMKKVEKQTEHLTLLKAELKEVKKWKEDKEDELSKSQLHLQKQEEYKQQLEMLTLKLEAAELAAKSQKRTDSDESKGRKDAVVPRRRAEQLKLELENVRKRYAKLSIQIVERSAANMEKTSEDIFRRERKQLEVEMDYAIQSAVQTALESIEEEWEEKFQVFQEQLNNVTQYTSKVEDERDAALKRLDELMSSSPTKEQQEILEEELTDELTKELTDKITIKLSEELTSKIEKRFRKKYKKLQQELHSKSSNEDQNQRQAMQAEIMNMKQRYESEYALKLLQVQQQHEEQVKLQKEKMRKLVRALLERESKHVQTTENYSAQNKDAGDKSNVNSENAAKKKRTDRSARDGDSADKELVTSSTTSPLAKKNRSQPGLVPVRGNTGVK